jgi:NAD(P)H-dependent flavin oxidoreductase YrpB (nitropropane dioxygenase family)
LGCRADGLAFGVDLLLPQLGGNARKTNYDYTKGKLMDLIDVIIEEKTKLFVCAVGVPPKEVVEKLHKAGILVMNVSPLIHLQLD